MLVTLEVNGLIPLSPYLPEYTIGLEILRESS